MSLSIQTKVRREILSALHRSCELYFRWSRLQKHQIEKLCHLFKLKLPDICQILEETKMEEHIRILKTFCTILFHLFGEFFCSFDYGDAGFECKWNKSEKW